MSNDLNRTQLRIFMLVTTAALTSACSGGGSSDTSSSAPATGTASISSSVSSSLSSTSSSMSSSQSSSVSSSRSSSVSSTTALAISGEPSQSVALNTMYYFKAIVTGNAAGQLTYSIRNKPAWATLNTLTGELKGTPTQAGTFANIAISATDGRTSVTLAPFAIQVFDNRVNVTISWAAPTKNTDGSELDNLSGFAIHYGTSPNALNKVVSVASRNARSYLLTDLTKGTTYYFAVAAVNDMNIEGHLSEVSSIVL